MKLQISVTVLPHIQMHAGICEGDHIFKNVSMRSTGMPV